MRKPKYLILVLGICSYFQSAHAQTRSEIAIPPNGDNERAEVSQWVGLVKIWWAAARRAAGSG